MVGILLELNELDTPEQKWMLLDENLPQGQYQLAACGKNIRMLLIPKMTQAEGKDLAMKLKEKMHLPIGYAYLEPQTQLHEQDPFHYMVQSAREHRV